MDYKQKLIVAAKCVYDGDPRAAEEARVGTSEYGIKATLKPHQVEGVSWLIRRYHLGVNVILGIVNLFLFRMEYLWQRCTEIQVTLFLTADVVWNDITLIMFD